MSALRESVEVRHLRVGTHVSEDDVGFDDQLVVERGTCTCGPVRMPRSVTPATFFVETVRVGPRSFVGRAYVVCSEGRTSFAWVGTVRTAWVVTDANRVTCHELAARHVCRRIQKSDDAPVAVACARVHADAFALPADELPDHRGRPERATSFLSVRIPRSVVTREVMVETEHVRGGVFACDLFVGRAVAWSGRTRVRCEVTRGNRRHMHSVAASLAVIRARRDPSVVAALRLVQEPTP